MPVTQTTDRVRVTLDAIDYFTKNRVLVGIPSDKTARPDNGGPQFDTRTGARLTPDQRRPAAPSDADLEFKEIQGVTVGVSKDGKKATSAATNALIGYVMEFGSPIKNIPARPHLVPGVMAAQDDLSRVLKQVARNGLKGDMGAVDRGLNAAGLIAVNSVKRTINSNIQPALAPRTLAARKRRGVTRTNTLVDTTEYRDSMTYVVDRS